jgi:hypothetical protein
MKAAHFGHMSLVAANSEGVAPIFAALSNAVTSG